MTPTESTSPNLSSKTVTGNYVGDPYICAKFGANLSTGASVEMSKIYGNFFYLFLSHFSGFSHLMAQMTRNDAKMCLLGSR